MTIDEIFLDDENVFCRPQTYSNHAKLLEFFHLANIIADSAVERTVLMEKILPVLKASYIERGYEFDLIDPHWGVTDLVSENHSDQELCLSLVRSAAQNDETVNFMVSIIYKQANLLAE